MAGDVVLGYDGSEGSKAALRVAVTVAGAFDAPLTIVFGYEPNPMGGETADYKNQLEKIGSDHLAEAVKEAKALDPSVAAEPIVAALRPVESLLEASLERRARVIVVGGSGERPIMGAILGSVPHKLLHRSTVPVLVVPTPED
ncbi:MAG TPA: universal stress protein [Acidimicrobiales bacterium]|nr:universal stress protein [Acidimicrobiales bacterium]HLN40950.1 universal stress protein [Acidimicrobiales bacterium]